MSEQSRIFLHTHSNLFWGHQQWQAGDFLATTSSFISQLEDFGVGHADKVVYAIDKHPFSFLWCELALSQIDCLLIPCNFQYTQKGFFEIKKHICPSYILTDSRTLALWISKTDNSCITHLIEAPDGTKLHLLKLPDQNTRQKNELTGTILMSSGTSHYRRYSLQSSQNFRTSIEAFSSTSIFEKRKDYLNLLPLYFSGGRKVFYSCLKNNIHIHFPPNEQTDDFCDITSGTPNLLESFISHKKNIQNVRFICGGAPLSNKLIELACTKQVEVYNVYGLSETSSIASFNTPQHHKLGTVGKLCTLNEYKIQDKTLRIKGPSVCAFQFIDGEAKQVLEDGWLDSRDIATIDDDGYLILQGRIDDEIKMGNGMFINLATIHKILEKYFTDFSFFIQADTQNRLILYIPDLKIHHAQELSQRCTTVNQQEIFKIHALCFFKISPANGIPFSKQIIVNSDDIRQYIEI